MDYYYSLLESYELLKKRKFKLSLREEVNSAEMKAKGYVSQAQAVSYSDALPVDGGGGGKGTIWTTTKGTVSFSTNPDKTFPHNNVVAGSGEGWDALLGFVGGKEKAKGEDDKGAKPGEEVDPMALPVEVSQDSVVIQKQTDIIERLSNLKDTGLLTDKQLTSLTAQVEGKAKGTRIDPEEVGPEMATMGPDKTKEQIVESLDSTDDLIESYSKLESGKKIEDLELNKLADHLIITPHGVRMGGLFRQYRRELNPDNDAYLAMATRISKEQESRTEEWRTLNQEFIGPPPIKIIKKEEKPFTYGQETANRGVIAEKLEPCALALDQYDLAVANGDKKSANDAKKKLGTLFETAIGDGSAEELMTTFAGGSDTLLGNHFSNRNEMGEAAFVQGVKDILTDPKGNHKLLPETVDALVDLGGRKNGVALALVVLANRQFSTDLYAGATPSEIIQTGQGKEAQELGDKADLIAYYDEGSCDKVTKAWGDKLSDSQRSHYALGCGGEGIGLDSLVNKEDGRCKVEQELKVVSKKDNKISFGESSHNRARDVSRDSEGLGETTREYLEVHNKRMDDCGKNIRGNAEKVQSDLDTRTRGMRLTLNSKTEPLTPEQVEAGKEPLTLEMKMSYIQQWENNKAVGDSTLTTKQKARSAGAKKALSQPDKATKEDRKHLRRMKEDLEEAELSRMIPDGKLSGDSLDYLMNRMSLTGGSTNEVVKVGRKLDDRLQTVGLNNAEIYGCIGGLQKGSLNMVKSGNTYHIESMKGDKRFSIEMHRGRMRLVCTGNVANIISSPDLTAKKKSSGPKGENLLISFLQGQQHLLEKLLNQTT